MLPQPEDGKHDPFKAVPAYLRFISQRVAGGDLKGARIAKYAVETSLRELEYKVRCKELVSREAVEKEWFSIGRSVRDNFQNLPSRTAGLVAAERNQQRCYDNVGRLSQKRAPPRRSTWLQPLWRDQAAGRSAKIGQQ